MNKYSIAMVLALLVSCDQDKEERDETAKESLSHEQISMKRQACVGADSTCAVVSMAYPVFSGEKEMLPGWLNAHVKEQLLMYLQWGEDTVKTDQLEVAADNFLTDFEAFSADFSAASMPWFVDTKATVTYDGSKAISLAFSNSSFTGGAHPNHTVMFLNFDLKRRQLLQNEEIVLDKPKLLEKAEKAFKAFHAVDPAVSLEEDGRFFLEEGKFFLPASMGYEGKAFVLIYNSYEIGPYSMGQTVLEFPLNELDEIVWMPGKVKGPTN
ncbi:DUF3298 and DUF4163 domain-containing protein [Echinicola soli]|uniref:DUF3298 and DUF4163 domain-containing protein n=1 Tax=Echinicola soli TaxID=2591634 RepID=A0A514CCG9_9BACT|nr:DUF3298 and DUF4163 domain-containing protein [Echinicola soli]QDH77509.1 DUF3298 and DUF4163 domain-containing protein [Echinicola soli]